MIIQMRRRLMKSAQKLMETGEAPPEIDNPSLARLRPLQMILPRSANWLEVGGDWMFGRAKEPPPEASQVGKPPARSATDPLRETALVIKTPVAIKIEVPTP